MNKKKIVLVNTVYGSGSVGRITADLYHTAEQNGMDAAVAYGRSAAPTEIKACKIGSRPDFYRHVCYNFLKDGSGFGSKERTRRFLSWLDKEAPDILHLHNLHGFYIQVEQLFDYIKVKKIPTIWTLHDCWPFTGHCAYYDKNDCRKWKNGCQNCDYHRSAYPYALFCDNSAENYRRKKEAFCGVEELVIVTPSQWLAKEVRQSFLGQYPVQVIPNGIDTERFCPQEKTRDDQMQTFEILGAANVWEDRKGLAYLEQLAGEMPTEWHMTLIGLSKRQQKSIEQRFDRTQVSAMGRTDSIEKLAEAYQRADVFVNPTLEDVFSMTNLEALACGTPVVTFPTGGSPETLCADCGLVTENKSAQALCKAIETIRRQKMQGSEQYSKEACRKWALCFDKIKRYGEYMDLYRNMGQRMQG